MDPLEVHALNSQFEMIAPNIPYTNLQWCRKYYECGHFEMTVPSSIFSTDWKYIYTEDRPETGIVQKVEFSDTEHVAGGDDIITISGFFTDKWLDDYVFLVEETDTEKEYIQKPPPVLAKKPELYVDKDGNVYNKSHGKYITSGGKETDLTDADVTIADVKVSNGVSQGKWSTDRYYSNKFNYYKDKNGAIYQVNNRGEEEKLADSFTSIFATAGTPQGAVYKNQDGSFTWVPEVAYNKDFTNFRQCEKWEENTKGLEVITVEEGTFAIKYRTVKGAYQLRTEIDEVGKEADNIETILKWGARIFGDGVYFDRPDFHGVKKVLDPSLKKFGELCREELQSIGASVRMFYAFKSNRIVMQIWRGLDRTQDQGGEPEKPRKNPFVVFSDEWGNLNGFTASRDESNYKNKAYVLFDYDEPNNWREDGSPSGIWYRDWGNSDSPADQLENSDAGYHIPYTTKRGYETVRLDDGLNDAEIYIDLRSEKPEFDGDWPRGSTTVDETKALVGMRQQYEQWAKHYKEEGLKALENDYCVVTNIDAGTFDSNKYLEDYDLGDEVDIIISKIGMSETARIIEINEVYESGNADIMLTMGDQVVSISKKARLV